MDCNNLKTHLQSYLDGELAPVDRETFDRHIAGCQACRNEVERFKAFEKLLRNCSIPDVPENLTGRIMGEASRQKKGRPLRLPIQPSAIWGIFKGNAMRAAAAVVLVAGLASGSLLGWSLTPDGSAHGVAVTEVEQIFSALSDSSIEPLVTLYFPDNTNRQ